MPKIAFASGLMLNFGVLIALVARAEKFQNEALNIAFSAFTLIASIGLEVARQKKYGATAPLKRIEQVLKIQKTSNFKTLLLQGQLSVSMLGSKVIAPDPNRSLDMCLDQTHSSIMLTLLALFLYKRLQNTTQLVMSMVPVTINSAHAFWFKTSSQADVFAISIISQILASLVIITIVNAF